MAKDNKKTMTLLKKVGIGAIGLGIILLIIFLIPFDKCSESKEEKDSKNVILEVLEDDLVLEVGDIYKLNFKATLYGNPYDVVSVKLVDSNIGHINENYELNVTAPGVTEIIFASGNKIESIKLTVNTPTVQSLSITGNRNIKVGDSLQLYCSSNNEFVKAEVIWSVDNEDVATIDANGVVTGKKVGTVIVSATLIDNPEVKATVKVYVISKE